MDIQERSGLEIQTSSKEYLRITNLPEHQESVSPLKDGIVLTGNVPEDLLKKISWESKMDENYAEFYTPLGVQYVVYSQPAIYSSGLDFPKVVDLCVVSGNRDIALESFRKKKEESDKIKETRQRLLEPYITCISEIEGVSFLAGRGSTFDKRRICTVHDDSDISCFVEFKSSEDLDRIFSELKEEYRKIAEGLNVKVLEISFCNSRNADGKTVVDTIDPKFEVSFDIIAIDAFKDTERIEDIKEGDPYIVDTFCNYIFLSGDKDRFEAVRGLFDY